MFLQASMMLRTVHTFITETHGFSPYVSYAFFGVVTIIVGGLLGLVRIILLELPIS